MIAIIDYGVGNLASVQNAFRQVGFNTIVTSDPQKILRAGQVVLPGVGAFADAMESLKQSGLVEIVQEVVLKETPLLGVCLGMQMLFSVSEEDGIYDGLNLIPGRVKRFRLPTGYKVPHMGWNQIVPDPRSRLFKGIPPHSYFYFVHSYYTEPEDGVVTAAHAHYGIPFTCAVEQGNVFGAQFHPEKSSRWGLRVLRNFGEMLMR